MLYPKTFPLKLQRSPLGLWKTDQQPQLSWTKQHSSTYQFESATKELNFESDFVQFLSQVAFACYLTFCSGCTLNSLASRSYYIVLFGYPSMSAIVDLHSTLNERYPASKHAEYHVYLLDFVVSHGFASHHRYPWYQTNLFPTNSILLFILFLSIKDKMTTTSLPNLLSSLNFFYRFHDLIDFPSYLGYLVLKMTYFYILYYFYATFLNPQMS